MNNVIEAKICRRAYYCWSQSLMHLSFSGGGLNRGLDWSGLKTAVYKLHTSSKLLSLSKVVLQLIHFFSELCMVKGQ